MEAHKMVKRTFPIEQLVPHLLVFSYYFLLFLCIFTTIPIIFFNIGYFRFSFSETQALIGLISILFVPSLANGIIFFILSKKKSKPSKFFSYKQLQWLTFLCYCEGILQYALFRLWLNGFDGHSSLSFSLMFAVLLGSMIIASMVYLKIYRCKKGNFGILIASILVGIFYAVAVKNFNNIFLLNAVAYVIFPILLYFARGKDQKLEDLFEEHCNNSYLWLTKNTQHRLQPFGVEFIHGILFIILFSELFLPVFYYDLDTPILALNMLFFFICTGIGFFITESTQKLTSRTSILIIFLVVIINLAISEIFRPFLNSVFSSGLCGFALGILLSENIKFKPFGRRAFPMFSGFIFMVLFSIILAVGGNLLIVYEGLIIRGRIVLTMFFLILGLLCSIIAIVVAKCYQKKERN